MRTLDIPALPAAIASISFQPSFHHPRDQVGVSPRVRDSLDALAVRARAGDAAACRALFGALLTRLRPIVSREATRRGRPLHAADVDDTVQELAATIWTHDLHRYDPARGSFASFVRKRVAWKLVDDGRSRARHTAESLDARLDDGRDPVAAGAAPDELLAEAARERALQSVPRAVAQALGSLRDVQARTAFERVDVDGAPLTRVAAELGVHPSNACRARRRALRFLSRTMPRSLAAVA